MKKGQLIGAAINHPIEVIAYSSRSFYVRVSGKALRIKNGRGPRLFRSKEAAAAAGEKSYKGEEIMAYKSVRLLSEAIHKEMEELRKLLMVEVADDTLGDVSLANADAQEKLIELRKMFEELTAMAERPTIDDVLKMSPGDYVATMKPLVGKYHRQLHLADLLCSCINEDLQVNATILMLVGDEKTIVRTAHDPNRPEVALAVEVILASLDNGTKQVAGDGAAALEEMAGLPATEPFTPCQGAHDEPCGDPECYVLTTSGDREKQP